MIQVKEDNVKFHGNFAELMSDLACLFRILIEENALDKYDILKCVDFACMTEEEIEKETEKLQKSVEAKLKILFGENVELNF